MTFEDLFNEWNDDSDFITACSSGSTGKPKTIKLDKEFVKESALRTISFFKLDKDSRLHSCVSPDYIGGKMMAIRSWILGACFSWEVPSNKPLIDIDISSVFDLVAIVPSQMFFLLENKQRLPRIKNYLIGGSSLSDVLKNKIEESGIDAFESYGMTETASHIALRKIVAEDLPFTTLPGIKVSLNADETLSIHFKNGNHIKTNDLAKVISDTEFYIVGRKDNVIISGGKKINPVELEKRISPFIKKPFIITGLPDDKWGEKVVLIIETAPFDEKILRREISTVLKSWEMPKDIRFVNQLPITKNGKAIRNKSILEKLF